jgi:outer membrane assembly lipoprotein YfiO
MPHPRLRPVGLALAALVLAGCSGAVVQRASSPSGLYERGLARFQKGDDYEAIKIFEELIRNDPGSEYIDDAMYYLGRSYIDNSDYALAATELDQLVSDHPESPYVPEAEFYIGESDFLQMRSPQYDPERTEQALSQFRRFIRLYPNSPLKPEADKRIAACLDWLAEKNILAAKQYLKLGYPESARIYFQKVLNQFGDTSWAPEARLGLGRVYEKEGNVAAARDAYRSLLQSQGAVPENVRREAEDRLRGLEGRS